MEFQRPLHSSVEFDFNSGRASPCGSSPSTPKGFGDNYYFSAPTSPARTMEIYHKVENFYGVSTNNYVTDDVSVSDFTFATKIESKKSPMKPNTLPKEGTQKTFETMNSPLLIPKSPKIQHHNNNKISSFWSAFSPKRKKESDHYNSAIGGTTIPTKKQGRERARERVAVVADVSDSKSGRRAIRSLSPPRESKYYYQWEEEEEEEEQKSKHKSKEVITKSTATTSTLTLSSSSKGSSKKWRLKDFLLFRSSSEGRAFEKDPLKKYSYVHRKNEAAKGSSSLSSIVSTRRGQVSAHELHYTVNKAISEDMRKKSFLPYKQGILGSLAINPTVHALAHGFGL